MFLCYYKGAVYFPTAPFGSFFMIYEYFHWECITSVIDIRRICLAGRKMAATEANATTRRIKANAP